MCSHGAKWTNRVQYAIRTLGCCLRRHHSHNTFCVHTISKWWDVICLYQDSVVSPYAAVLYTAKSNLGTSFFPILLNLVSAVSLERLASRVYICLKQSEQICVRGAKTEKVWSCVSAPISAGYLWMRGVATLHSKANLTELMFSCYLCCRQQA